MEDDQQFCLRWNNHQSTLISVFDTLLENGTLVDCTLAAEGKFLKAHKVVLSACSPYFATLLAQQYDKHPIFILKDVKYQELRAMMDYMYRGEVNISQDQLAALLKAAESLQIKGLSDNRGTATGAQHLQGAVPKQSTGKFSSAGLTIENKRTAAAAKLATESDVSVSREGSSSPSGRKRKKVRRRTVDQSTTVATETGSESLSNVTSNASSTAAANTTGSTVSSTNSAVAPNAVPSVSSAASPAALNITKKSDLSEPKKEQLEQVHRGSGAEDDEEDEDEEEEDDHHDMEPRAKRTTNRHDSNAGDELLEPKSEYDNDEPVEDLTLDDEELMEDLDQVGPSHGGEGSSHGYAWQVDRQDEVYMAGQEGSGQHRDSQAIADDFGITRISGLTWEQWNARLVAPLSTSTKQSISCGDNPASLYRIKTDSNSNHHNPQHRLNTKQQNKIDDAEHLFEQNHTLQYSSAESSRSPGEAGTSGLATSVPVGIGAASCIGDNSYGSSSGGGLLDYDDSGFSPLKITSESQNGNLVCTVGTSVGIVGGRGDYSCPECGRIYKLKSSLRNHQKWECGKEPQFQCPFCAYKAKQKMHIGRHLERMHKEIVNMDSKPSYLKGLIASRTKKDRSNRPSGMSTPSLSPVSTTKFSSSTAAGGVNK